MCLSTEKTLNIQVCMLCVDQINIACKIHLQRSVKYSEFPFKGSRWKGNLSVQYLLCLPAPAARGRFGPSRTRPQRRRGRSSVPLLLPPGPGGALTDPPGVGASRCRSHSSPDPAGPWSSGPMCTPDHLGRNPISFSVFNLKRAKETLPGQ